MVYWLIAYLVKDEWNGDRFMMSGCVNLFNTEQAAWDYLNDHRKTFNAGKTPMPTSVYLKP